MRIVSIDPSITCTGICCFEVGDDWIYGRSALINYDSFTPDQKDDEYARRSHITGSVMQYLHEWSCDLVVYEKASNYHYRRGAMNLKVYLDTVSETRKTCQDYFRGDFTKIIGVTAPTWKQTGKKKATIDNVNMYFGLDLQKKDNDMADAIGLGMWFMDRQKCEHTRIDYKFTG